MNVRVRPEGGVIIEAEAAVKIVAEAYIARLKDISRRQPFRGFSTEEVMQDDPGED